MTDPADVLEIRETRTVHISLRRDGIIVQRMLPVARQTLQDARDNLATFSALAGAGQRPMLLDARANVALDPGVTDYYTAAENTGSIAAMAVLITSRFGRSVANFFLAVKPQDHPTRMFTSEDDAIAWLKKVAPPG